MSKKTRVRRPKQYETLMNDLCRGENSVFDTFADLLVFSAVLGAHRNVSKPFEKTSEAVQFHIFSSDIYQTVFNTIALKHAAFDPTIMGNENLDEKIGVFEEYAHGGLEILATNLDNSPPETYQDKILNLMLRSERKNSILNDITGLA